MAPVPDDRETLEAPETGAPLWSGAPALSPPPVPAAERYVVVRELARGGLGRVLEAYDQELQRPVALKELLRDAPGARARFRREILLTARLQHPAIVSLYEAVRGADGVERYAMRLVSGTTLDVKVAAAGDARARLALLRHVIAVADALAYAHAQGVIHRDVKPQNILIGPFGETVLIDWGVAKRVADADPAGRDDADAEAVDLTRVGSIVGTPAYMAPEQARGEPADARSDVYALGATLWHVLAGRPPFGRDTASTLEALRRGASPPDLAATVDGVPDDLAAIVRRATAARAEGRYPTALALSEDLQRFATGQLVDAHHYTLAERAVRVAMRHRGILAVGVGAGVVLAGVLAASASRVIEERDAAEAALDLAETREAALILANARAATLVDPTDAAAWLKIYPPDGAAPDVAWNLAQDAAARGVARSVLRTPDGSCDAVVWGAQGRHLHPAGLRVQVVDAASGATSGDITRVDDVLALPDGTVLRARDSGTVSRVDATGRVTRLGAMTGPLAAWAADDDVVVAGDRGGALVAYRLDGGGATPLWSSEGHVVGVGVVEGRWVAAWGDGAVWEGAVGGGPATLRWRAEGPATALVAAPGGAVVMGLADGAVVQLDGSGVTTRARLPGAVAALALSPGGRWLAAADSVDQVAVVDGSTGAALSPPWRPERAAALAWSPAGDLLAVTLTDGEVRLWRPGTGAYETRRAFTGLMAAAAFTPEGSAFATCAVDGALRTWSTPAVDASLHLGHEGRTFHVAWLPDGRLVSDSDDHTVRLWADDGGEPWVLRAHDDRVYGVDVSPDGARVVTSGVDGLATVWSTRTGEAVPLRGHVGRVHRAVFLDDARVLTAGQDGTLRIWGVDGTARSVTPAHDGAVWWAAVGDDGAVWTAGSDRAVRRWWPEGGEAPEVMAEGLGPRGGVTLRPYVLPGGRAVVCAGDGDDVLVLGGDAAQRWSLPGTPSCPSMASRGWDVLVPYGTSLGLLDARDGQVRVLTTLDAEVHAVALSPDGAFAAAAVLDGTARVWRLSDGAGAILHRADGPVLGVAFSRDGGRLAAASADATVWSGAIRGDDLVPRAPHALRDWLERLTTATPPP